MLPKVAMKSLKFYPEDASHYQLRSRSSGSDKFTFSTWLRVTNNQLISNVFSIGGNESYLEIFTDGSVKWGPKPGTTISSVAGSVEFGRWYHIVVVNDKSTGGRIYLNNQLILSGDGMTANNSGADIYFGNYLNRKEGLNGYMSQTVWIEESEIMPSNFGKLYGTKWGPIDDSEIIANVNANGGFGDNGFFVNYNPTNGGGYLENILGTSRTLTPINLTANDVYNDDPMNVHAVLEDGDNGGLVPRGSRDMNTIPFRGVSGQSYYYEVNGVGRTYTAENTITVTQGDQYNFGQFTFSDTNTGNLPLLIQDWYEKTQGQGITLYADDPDDVATFNAVKDALEAYEPTRTEAQVSVLKKLNEAGLTPEELVVANGITTADVTKYAAAAEASTKPAKRGRKK